MQKGFDPNNPMQVGGQAVIEGVMMRAPGMVATAVRRSNGSIEVKKEPYRSIGERYAAFKLPVLRGAVGLIEMMVIGVKTLNYSASTAMEDTQPERNGRAKSSSSESLRLGVTVFISLLVGLAIFFVTPLLVTTRLFSVEQDPLVFNLISGAFRIGLLLCYLTVISLMKDVRRLFEYHGAEHKAVFAFELGETLDVSSAARQVRFHPRCGTSFLLIVMFVSIVLFSLLDVVLIQWLGRITFPLRLATHLPLIPLVGGISYECIKASAKKSETILGKFVVTPGLWLQKITTKEPDERQLEVAVVALRCALGEEYIPSGSPLLQEASVN